MSTEQNSSDILARLVSFDTTSRHSNLDLIAYVRSILDAHHVPYRVSLNEEGTKANLHAIIGPETAGGIALSGHVDTVPVDGQTWQSDPFTLTRRDGKLYGRGAADMKGFVACMLAAVPALKALPLKRPIHLFITYDEEITMAGARRLMADVAESGLKPSSCIVGEPSGMQPILAHKGKLDVLVEVRGKPGHSSAPGKGVNAIYAAASAIEYIARENARHAKEGPFEDGFDPPHTTLHVGTVQGGAILNIIPEYAQFVMEWRDIPADDSLRELEALKAFVARGLEPAMHAVSPDTGFSFRVLADVPAMALPWTHPLADLARALTGRNQVGKVSYGTEGGIFQNAGIPTLVCGPGHIAQAHQPDEFIAESELAACDRFIARLAERLIA